MIRVQAFKPSVGLVWAVLVVTCAANRLAGQGIELSLSDANPSADFYLVQQPGSVADPQPPGVLRPPTDTDTDSVLPRPDSDDTARAARSSRRSSTRRFTGLRYASSRPSELRLASVPNMLGDFFSPTAQLQYDACCGSTATALADIPLAAGGRRMKISENNKALPMDRVYFNFNHFHNAVDTTPDVGAFFAGRSGSINRYTLGVEKTFLQKQVSVDIRMPLAEKVRSVNGAMGVEGGNVGDLGLVLKGLLYSTEDWAAGIGLGITFPTGSDVTARAFDTKLMYKNEAVHLSPFIGVMCAPNNAFFFQGFIEVDKAMQGNGVDVVYPGTFVTESLGSLTDQTLMHIDATAGWWIVRNPDSHALAGLAAIAEFHYTTTLEDADVLSGSSSDGDFQFGNLLNRMDVCNVSTGLHLRIHGTTTLRVAAVFPLDNRPDNPFDAEVTMSLNYFH